MASFYIVPKVLESTPFGETWRPKYIPAMGVRWAAMDYGLDPQFLVGANVSQAQHDFLAAQSDVIVIPPLDQQVGGNPTLNQVRNRLEQQNIPASWIQATTTWRQVTGNIGRYSMLLQRLHGMHNQRLFEPGVSLDSTLTPTLLSRLQGVGTSFLPALNVSALTLTTTVRDALMGLGDQIPRVDLMGEVF